jgi:hypothetical protein
MEKLVTILNYWRIFLLLQGLLLIGGAIAGSVEPYFRIAQTQRLGLGLLGVAMVVLMGIWLNSGSVSPVSASLKFDTAFKDSPELTQPPLKENYTEMKAGDKQEGLEFKKVFPVRLSEPTVLRGPVKLRVAPAQKDNQTDVREFRVFIKAKEGSFHMVTSDKADSGCEARFQIEGTSKEQQVYLFIQVVSTSAITEAQLGSMIHVNLTKL